jgi:hypothetical protein
MFVKTPALLACSEISKQLERPIESRFIIRARLSDGIQYHLNSCCATGQLYFDPYGFGFFYDKAKASACVATLDTKRFPNAKIIERFSHIMN